MRRTRIIVAALGAIFTTILLLGGCNTIEGIGNDVAASGQTLSNWAKDSNPGK